MIYPSLAVANTFLFLHNHSHEQQVVMDIERLHQFCFLAHTLHTQDFKTLLIDELIIVGDYFPMYEGISRAFSDSLEGQEITSYGKMFDYQSQRQIIPFIEEEDGPLFIVREVYKNFCLFTNRKLEHFLNHRGTCYNTAASAGFLFIHPQDVYLRIGQ